MRPVDSLNSLVDKKQNLLDFYDIDATYYLMNHQVDIQQYIILHSLVQAYVFPSIDSENGTIVSYHSIFPSGLLYNTFTCASP